jgi:hypothetical protein
MNDNTEVMEVIETENIDTDNEPEIDTESDEMEVPEIDAEADEKVVNVDPISIDDWNCLNFDEQLEYLASMKKCVKKNIRLAAREVAKKQKKIDKLLKQLAALQAA